MPVSVHTGIKTSYAVYAFIAGNKEIILKKTLAQCPYTLSSVPIKVLVQAAAIA